MFNKLIQKVVVDYVKSQSKVLAKQAIVSLEAVNEDVTADAIVKVVESFLIKKGIVFPAFIADPIEDKLSDILDKVRDEAVKLINLKVVNA